MGIKPIEESAEEINSHKIIRLKREEETPVKWINWQPQSNLNIEPDAVLKSSYKPYYYPAPNQFQVELNMYTWKRYNPEQHVLENENAMNACKEGLHTMIMDVHGKKALHVLETREIECNFRNYPYMITNFIVINTEAKRFASIYIKTKVYKTHVAIDPAYIMGRHREVPVHNVEMRAYIGIDIAALDSEIRHSLSAKDMQSVNEMMWYPIRPFHILHAFAMSQDKKNIESVLRQMPVDILDKIMHTYALKGIMTKTLMKVLRDLESQKNDNLLNHPFFATNVKFFCSRCKGVIC